MSVLNELVLDAFARVIEDVREVLNGLEVDDLRWRPEAASNPIGWLIWHLSRVEDDHLAALASAVTGQAVPQVYLAGGFMDRFALPYPAEAHGYGMTPEQVGAFTLSEPAVLGDYYDAVHGQTLSIVGGMHEADYATIVDRRWTPPVTAATRLVSVINDVTQHVGQAAYVTGLRERSR